MLNFKNLKSENVLVYKKFSVSLLFAQALEDGEDGESELLE